VLYASTAQKIYDAYVSFQRTILFGGEKICSHHFPESRLFFDSQTNCGPYRYLNSGLIIGKVFELKRMLKAIRTWDIPSLKRTFENSPHYLGAFNDQMLFGRWATLNPESTAIDTHSLISRTLTGECLDLSKYIAVGRHYIRSQATGREICMVHVPYLRKFYPAILSIAHVIGLYLSSRNVDLVLFKQHLLKEVEGIDRHELEIDPTVREQIEPFLNTATFQLNETISPVFKAWKKCRYYLAKLRRSCFTL
jgi:hypothetical protein